MKLICPICGQSLETNQLNFHCLHHHPEELKARGYPKIKTDARRATPVKKIKEAPKKQSSYTEESQGGDKDIESMTDQTQKPIQFYPSPATLMLINMFTKGAEPSDFINICITAYGQNHGVQAAVIKTEGGQALNLVGSGDPGNEDKEFDRILKLTAASAQVNQSFNQNTPMIQMIQMMKERVNKGMPMQEFLMMMKMLEPPPPPPAPVQSNGFDDLLQIMIMNKLKGGK